MNRKKKIKLLDLCCGAGGAAMGYYQAAKELGLKIEITGIDINPQPNYPFKFKKADAVEYLKKHWHKFTHVHASPPCQKYSKITAQFRKKGKIYNDNLNEIRSFLYSIDIPAIIENVPNSPLRPDIVLRGDMFNLNVLRKRHFETVNCFILNPILDIKHGSVRNGDYVTVVGKEGLKANKNHTKTPKFRKKTILETWKYAMQIDWMTKGKEFAEAIPPAYTKYIGIEFLLKLPIK